MTKTTPGKGEHHTLPQGWQTRAATRRERPSYRSMRQRRDHRGSANPGARGRRRRPRLSRPHVWLGQPAAKLSTIDLVSDSFTLLVAPDGDGWSTAATAAERHGVPISVYRIGRGAGLGDLGGFADAYGIGSEVAVLIRPDGHVAYRSTYCPESDDVLSVALSEILSR